MKRRSFIAALGLILISVFAFIVAGPERVPWVITALLCFGGILLFDCYAEMPRSWMNLVIFLSAYCLILGAVLAPTAEAFWRNFAGALFLSSLLFEQNALAWSGFGPFRTTVTPAMIFFLFVLAQNIPALPAATTYSFCICAILVASYLELFSIFRENSAMNAGSFMAAMRLACTGLGALFYCGVFLPEVAKQPEFSFLYVALPALAVAVSIFGAMLRHWRRRHILFYCNWSVFVFWAALTGDQERFFAAMGALVAGVWSIMSTHREAVNVDDPRDVYLRLSSWGVPGSLLFSMMVFALKPSGSTLIREGSALWLISFFIFWWGLYRFKFPTTKVPDIKWTWRRSIALTASVVGASFLAGGHLFAEFISQFWSPWGGTK